MKKLLLTALIALTTTLAFSQKLDTLRYKSGGNDMIGFIAKPKNITKSTKTIMIVHEWWGLTEYPKNRALQLAKEGFIAFCVDMYGNGLSVDTPDEAKKHAMPFYADPQMSYNRFMDGYNALVADKSVNPSLMAAIGYCFGGTVCLNAAKMGAPVDAVVSFHGGLAGVPVEKDKMKAAVLVCHGLADSFVPQTDVDAFKKEMTDTSIDFTFIAYPEATHAFTNPKATEKGQKFNMPIAYNEVADKKSYADFKKFIAAKVVL